MDIFMPEKQKKWFKDLLLTSCNYFEFGCGGSTVYASNHCKNVYSIESDYEWCKNVKKHINNANCNVECIHVDIETKPNNWGYPGDDCCNDKKRVYSNMFTSIKNYEKIDTILIDGRFRVACALNILPYISSETRVLFDDFLNRQHQYKIVLDYYDIEKSVGNMVLLKKKDNHEVHKSILSKYEVIPQ